MAPAFPHLRTFVKAVGDMVMAAQTGNGDRRECVASMLQDASFEAVTLIHIRLSGSTLPQEWRGIVMEQAPSVTLGVLLQLVSKGRLLTGGTRRHQTRSIGRLLVALRRFRKSR